MPAVEQLLLNLRPRPDARLSDFAAPAWAPVVAALEAFLEAPGGLLYLRGDAGLGRSHLLSALCGEAERRGMAALLLPLGELRGEDPGLLQGLEAQDLVACDDLEAIAGQGGWEEAFFHFFNRARATGCRLLFSAAAGPGECGFRLPDLVSRLAQAPCWALAQPDDASREALVMAAARRHDLALEPDVVRYLLGRGPRETGRLLALVADLDRLSLVAGRRLTIPFVREVLERPGGQGGEPRQAG
ncbi:MAG TPA: DnaA regulatory inactivator Hda [Moraxellaceae bacterium]|nr:DnaA regulatory inactivator Hda [Moraxellaceae bacterium]